ncbi:MAG TPA: hypothetical protein VGK30_02135 [Candidatus Binatia bacterium]|jgi:hypothetical protein
MAARGRRGRVVVAVALAALVSARTAAADPSREAGQAATDVTDVVGAAAAADLGIVPVGDEARHTFRLVNGSAVPLTLTPERLSPGVTLRVLDRTIPPGTSGRAEVTLDGFAFAGPTRVEVPLTSDDPARSTIRLTLTADVRAFVIADPGYARYLFVQGAAPGTIGQTIFATDGAAFRVTRVTSPLPALRVSVRPASADERAEGGATGSQWRIESTLASQAPVGPLGGFLEVALDHPRQHRMRIPLSGFVRPMFAVTPADADLGDVRAGEPVRGRLVVKNFADERVTLEHVGSDVPGVTGEAQTADPGHAFSIALAVAADARPGRFDGRLRIRTSSAKQRLLEVPIHGTILAPDHAANAAGVIPESAR